MDPKLKPIEKHYTIQHVAEMLAMSVAFVKSLVDDGTLRAVTLGRGLTRPRGIRIPASSINAYMAARYGDDEKT